MTVALDIVASQNTAASVKAGASILGDMNSPFAGASDFMAMLLAGIEPGTQTQTNGAVSLLGGSTQNTGLIHLENFADLSAQNVTLLNSELNQTQSLENNFDIISTSGALLSDAVLADTVGAETIVVNADVLASFGLPVDGTIPADGLLIANDEAALAANADLILIAPVTVQTNTQSTSITQNAGQKLPSVSSLNSNGLLNSTIEGNTVNVLSLNGTAPSIDANTSFEWRGSGHNTLTHHSMNATTAHTSLLSNSGMNALLMMQAQPQITDTPSPSFIHDTGSITLDDAGWSFDMGGDFLGQSDPQAEIIEAMITGKEGALKHTAQTQAFNSYLQSAKGPAYTHPATEQVFVSLEKAASGKLEKLSLQLDPASLGKIDIEMSFGEDGSLHTKIFAEKQETLDVLRNDARAIEKMLSDAGLKTDGNGLEFDLRQQQAFDGSTGENPSSPQSNSNFENALGSDDKPSLEITLHVANDAVLTADRVNILV